jgi:hypothetical protein
MTKTISATFTHGTYTKRSSKEFPVAWSMYVESVKKHTVGFASSLSLAEKEIRKYQSPAWGCTGAVEIVETETVNA